MIDKQQQGKSIDKENRRQMNEKKSQSKKQFWSWVFWHHIKIHNNANKKKVLQRRIFMNLRILTFIM